MTVPGATILEIIDNPQLWRPWFRNEASWSAWRAFLKALFGLEMDAAEGALFSECTGRTARPPGGCNEAWLIVGRRGGKSLMMAAIAVFLAVFRDWSPYLVPGESALVQVLAVDRKQARVIHRYARALLVRVPALANLVAKDQDDVLELTNGIAIEITTATFRAVRGYTVVAALLDEIAFWRSDESANPDTETLNAIRPAMATVPGAVLIGASSPYAKRGVLYDAFRRHYGRDNSPVLVWRAPTRTMNPTVPQAVIDEAMERDPASAAAEWLAEFRSDIETFVSQEAVDAAICPDRRELPPLREHSYVAFVDPSGGSGNSMTIAIAHREADLGVLDAVREVRPPFSPESVVQEFAALLKSYDLASVQGDRYGGEWPRERFWQHGISYDPTDKPKSDLYREMLPLLNSGKLELLDLPRLRTQLIGLERRTARGGRDSIDHPPGAHDDIANAAAGALVRAAGELPGGEYRARLA